MAAVASRGGGGGGGVGTKDGGGRGEERGGDSADTDAVGDDKRVAGEPSGSERAAKAKTEVPAELAGAKAARTLAEGAGSTSDSMLMSSCCAASACSFSAVAAAEPVRRSEGGCPAGGGGCACGDNAAMESFNSLL